MSETPSTRLIGAANATVTITDSLGRSLTLRRLSTLDRLRLFKALGAELAQNPPYLGMATLAVSVCAIDSVPQPTPANEAQIEALVLRLGDAGIAAIAAALTSEGQANAERLRQDAGN